MQEWSVDDDERLNCYYYRVEEAKVVLLLVVALKMVVCGCQEERRKGLVCYCRCSLSNCCVGLATAAGVYSGGSLG